MSFKVRLELAHKPYELKNVPLLPGTYTHVSVPVFQYVIPCNTRFLLHISNADGSDTELNGDIIITRANHEIYSRTKHIHHSIPVIQLGLPFSNSWLQYCPVGAHLTGERLNKIHLSLNNVCRYAQECDNLVSLHICGVLNQEEIDTTIFVKIIDQEVTYHNINQNYQSCGELPPYHYRAIDRDCNCGDCENPISSERFTQRQRFLLTLAGWSSKSGK